MASSQLINDYRQWLAFQRQEQLSREHQGVAQRLEDARATSGQVIQAYRSMADKAATEGACYRTLFLRESSEDAALVCEGWLFIRRVLSEEGSTRVRATLLETFTLEDGTIVPGDKPARKVTLEIYEKLDINKGMRTDVRVDCLETPADYHFITLMDAARGDLRAHMS
ncbi:MULTISPECIES: hypothetical protein [Halomonadaceae]|uniref:Uncharacterized protein n=1 Tax=Vreelandella malpeensis TaxID=1172368 RepID=A0ABS8DVN5_9GAMM|nr:MULTISPECIES: hypothetical protein [Halomonas]MCB8890392.1 hypothetical protein [Halomonas malpeensis]MCP1314868.1 hypothetical protein [Halomonas sp. 707D7]MCP1326931.1 hypothetical protein [Halomonas sp. 707D4]